MVDASTATQSTPWFAVTPDAQGSGLGTTNQDSSRNQQISGIANDLGDQNDSVVTAINSIATALNAKPSA